MSAAPTSLGGARGIGLLVVATFTAVAVFVTAWFPWREHVNGLAALEHKARNQAALVAYTIAPAVEFGDGSMIGEAFRGAERDTDFVGIAAVGANGATLASQGDVSPGRGVVVSVPITTPTGPAGTLTLVMSTARVDAESRTQLEVALAIGATILLLGVFVGVGVARSIRRIATLTDDNVRASATAEQERVKARFLANMSHEIRTPLNGVLGLADVLSRRSLDPQASALVASIVRSARNLLGLINDVLDLSRLESGRVEIEQAPFDPELSATTVCETLMSTAHERGLELVLDVAADVPASVNGDRLRVEQVLTNLVGNALKFTPQGRVVVALAYTDATLRASVRDTGIGIAASKLETVFEAFSQADASTTRRFGGTGLGLTISRELARRMGGDLSVESEEGVGSTFSFDVAAPRLAAASPPSLKRPPANVLIVSRDAVVAAALVRHGADCGLAVTVVARDELPARLAALGAGSGVRPLLVWDASLGALDGAARAAVKRAVDADELHLVMHASAIDPHHDDELASATLPKPFSRAAFAAALDDVGAPTARPAATGARAAKSLRILVAEDDATNRLVVTSLIDELGLHAELVGTGREALEAVTHRGPYALVLMDCQMPEMDGYEACRRIRLHETATGAKPIAIIAVTAHATAADRARADEAGMNGYVTKPLTLDSIRAAVQPLLPSLPTADRPKPAAVSLAEVFRRSADDGIELIGAALARADLPAVAREAHRLKGACLAIGDPTAAEAASALEVAARAGDAARCTTLTVELELTLADVGTRTPSVTT